MDGHTKVTAVTNRRRQVSLVINERGASFRFNFRRNE